MKIHQIITESILLEYNIIDTIEIDNIIDLFLKEKDVTDVFVINWLKKKVKNYINLTGEFLKLYNPTEEDKKKYPWLNKAIDNKQEIYRLGSVFSLRLKVDMIIDWVKSLNKEDEDYKKLDRISFEQALERHDRWMKKNDDIIRDDSKLVKTIYQFDDGYKIVELPDDYCKTREGQLMGHCVGKGGYTGKTIFSLRDRKNNPHATLELEGNKVVQLQGKENKDVVEKYHKYIIEFIENTNYTLNNVYLKKIGFIKLSNGIIDNLTVNDILDLSENMWLNSVSDNFKIDGSLSLADCKNLVSIGNNLTVNGSLYLRHCKSLISIGNNLTVGENLILYGCINLFKLPVDIQVDGNIYMDKNTKTIIPDNVKDKIIYRE